MRSTASCVIALVLVYAVWALLLSAQVSDVSLTRAASPSSMPEDGCAVIPSAASVSVVALSNESALLAVSAVWLSPRSLRVYLRPLGQATASAAGGLSFLQQHVHPAPSTLPRHQATATASLLSPQKARSKEPLLCCVAAAVNDTIESSSSSHEPTEEASHVRWFHGSSFASATCTFPDRALFDADTRASHHLRVKVFTCESDAPSHSSRFIHPRGVMLADFVDKAPLNVRQAAVRRFRGQQPPRIQLSVFTMIRNVARRLREWIEHYEALGVEQFIFYDDGSEDRPCEAALLAERIQRGSVTLVAFHAPKRTEHFLLQALAMNHCLDTFCSDSRWVLFVDVDEYVVLPSSNPNRYWAGGSMPGLSSPILLHLLDETAGTSRMDAGVEAVRICTRPMSFSLLGSSSVTTHVRRPVFSSWRGPLFARNGRVEWSEAGNCSYARGKLAVQPGMLHHPVNVHRLFGFLERGVLEAPAEDLWLAHLTFGQRLQS
jgi:hypothetical protein